MEQYTLHVGDCLEWLRTLDDNAVDSLVTDPPAGISFMGKNWDKAKGGRDKWIDWLCDRMSEARRVLKPGACGLVWALPRTSHWTATALENAGFEIRDIITHHFGTGFPKSKGCLKPAGEHWILCRKPVKGSIKNNPYGLGNLQIDACRIEGKRWPANVVLSHSPKCQQVATKTIKGSQPRTERQPIDDANRVAYGDGWKSGLGGFGNETVDCWACSPDCPVAELERQSKGASRFFYCAKPSRRERDKGCEELPQKYLATMGDGIGKREHNEAQQSAYVANNHPTVKALALMRWLTRLVCPTGGIVLDPFAGSCSGFFVDFSG